MAGQRWDSCMKCRDRECYARRCDRELLSVHVIQNPVHLILVGNKWRLQVVEGAITQR
jgi:hypothetical protein